MFYGIALYIILSSGQKLVAKLCEQWWHKLEGMWGQFSQLEALPLALQSEEKTAKANYFHKVFIFYFCPLKKKNK